VRNLIREAKIHQIPSIIQTGTQYGMQTLDQVLVELVTKRIVTLDEAITKTVNPDIFKEIQKRQPMRKAPTPGGPPKPPAAAPKPPAK
jgi:twitching motility protein PilT